MPINRGHRKASSRAGAVKGGNRKRLMRGLVLTAALMATTLVAAGSVYVGTASQKTYRSEVLTAPAATTKKRPPRVKKEPVNIVIVGETPRNGIGTAATDRVMVLHINKDRKAAAILSFPSNTYVPVAGRRWNTIGAAYEDGGIKLTVKTLDKLLGTKMNHSAVATQEGFLALSQQVGTINVNNPKAFTSVGYTFARGRITLSGLEVLAYVRGSGTDVAGDQANRQQLVIEAGIRKQLSGDLLSSPAKLAAFIDAASEHLTVDKALTPTRLATIAFSLDITESDVSVITVPLSSEVKLVKGLPVRKVDPVLFPELVNALKADRLDDYLAAHPNP